ncbi:MAG: hypothetical protein M3Q44_04320 [bacterium]|nr:hypothetical protein [bacterium]
MYQLDTTQAILNNALLRFTNYMPQFIAGLLLLIIGFIVAAIARSIAYKVLKIFKVDKWINSAEEIFNKVEGTDKKGGLWPGILAQLMYLTVLVLFLLPAFDAWGLNRVTQVLNELILFLPNIFIAVIVGFIGLGLARFVSDIVERTTKDLGSSSSHILANVARYSLVFFTSLIVLNQLGVAANLVQILFTGIVAMLALAGGLAFGIGGQEKAKELLNSLTQKVQETRQTRGQN